LVQRSDGLHIILGEVEAKIMVLAEAFDLGAFRNDLQATLDTPAK
jgi:hypothetical protein